MANNTVKFYHLRKLAVLSLVIFLLVLCTPQTTMLPRVSAYNTATSAATTGGMIGEFFEIGTDTSLPLFDQEYASVAYNPDRQEYLVVWHNTRPVYPDIQAQRVGKDGQLVGGPFYIAGGNNRQRRYPDVAYNTKQQEYLVVWEEIPEGGYANIYAQRVGPTGGLNGGAQVLGAGASLANRFKPTVAYAYTSDSYMVVWERVVLSAPSGDIEGQVVPGSGIPILLNFVIATGTATVDNSEPDIAYNRSRNEVLVVWTRLDMNANPNVKDVWGDILTAGGIPLVENLLIGYHTIDDYNASVVGTPTSPNFGGYYVTWEAKYSATDLDIYGRQVGWDGLMTPYHEISTSSYVDSEPAITYSEDNQQFFVTWTRVVNESLGTHTIRGQVFKVPVSVVANENVVGWSTYAEHSAVAAGSTGDFITVWDDAPWTSDRDVYGRIWGIRVYAPAVLRLH